MKLRVAKLLLGISSFTVEFEQRVDIAVYTPAINNWPSCAYFYAHTLYEDTIINYIFPTSSNYKRKTKLYYNRKIYTHSHSFMKKNYNRRLQQMFPNSRFYLGFYNKKIVSKF